MANDAQALIIDRRGLALASEIVHSYEQHIQVQRKQLVTMPGCTVALVDVVGLFQIAPFCL